MRKLPKMTKLSSTECAAGSFTLHTYFGTIGTGFALGID
jgi:hypothetical protein